MSDEASMTTPVLVNHIPNIADLVEQELQALGLILSGSEVVEQLSNINLTCKVDNCVLQKFLASGQSLYSIENLYRVHAQGSGYPPGPHIPDCGGLWVYHVGQDFLCGWDF